MIVERNGNILQDPSEAIVNTVNCVGVMGKGLALQFKAAFPGNFEKYRTACNNGQVVLGKMFITQQQNCHSPKYIVNFPTKNHWRDKSRMSDIVEGLSDLRREIEDRGIGSIAIPGLGCSLGGLDWQSVRMKIESELGDVDADVYLYAPNMFHSVYERNAKFKNLRMTRRLAAILRLKNIYENGMLDPHANADSLHGLVYLLQATGEALKLNFLLLDYGPYSKQLKGMIENVVSADCHRYGMNCASNRDYLHKAHEESEVFLAKHDSTRRNIERVRELIDGYESVICLELLTTTHWFIERNAGNVQAALDKAGNRNPRVAKFPKDTFQQVHDHLIQHGFCQPEQVLLI